MQTNPDKEKCRRIILEIDTKVPKKKYARKVQDYLRAKGHDEIPHIFKIQNVRNGKQYDLEIAEALQAISLEAEAEKKKAEADREKTEREKKGQLSIETVNK